MARPNSIADVTDRTNLVATFHTEFINTSPIMLKHYAAFIHWCDCKNWDNSQCFLLAQLVPKSMTH